MIRRSFSHGQRSLSRRDLYSYTFIGFRFGFRNMRGNILCWHGKKRTTQHFCPKVLGFHNWLQGPIILEMVTLSSHKGCHLVDVLAWPEFSVIFFQSRAPLVISPCHSTRVTCLRPKPWAVRIFVLKRANMVLGFSNRDSMIIVEMPTFPCHKGCHIEEVLGLKLWSHLPVTLWEPVNLCHLSEIEVSELLHLQCRNPPPRNLCWKGQANEVARAWALGSAILKTRRLIKWQLTDDRKVRHESPRLVKIFNAKWTQ